MAAFEIAGDFCYNGEIFIAWMDSFEQYCSTHKTTKIKLCKAEHWLHSRNQTTYFDGWKAAIQKTWFQGTVHLQNKLCGACDQLPLGNLDRRKKNISVYRKHGGSNRAVSFRFCSAHSGVLSTYCLGLSLPCAAEPLSQTKRKKEIDSVHFSVTSLEHHSQVCKGILQAHLASKQHSILERP